MNAVNVGLVTFIIQHNRIQGVFLLCKITNLLIYSTLTKDFCNVIFSKKPTKLDEWINVAQKYDIPELQTFINGIKKDITAVKNGIIYSYNNGLAEGSVNKIKVIKRIMYGRNSFELLKAKVLFGELFHVKFN